MNKSCIKSSFDSVCQLLIGYRQNLVSIQRGDYLFHTYDTRASFWLVGLNSKDMNYNIMKSP